MAFLSAGLAAVGSAIGGGGLGGIASIASTVLGAAGSIFSGIAANKAATYQAQVANMNADIANQNATRAQLSAQEEQRQQDNAAYAMLGEQEAGQGASGLSIGSGSFMATRRSARKLSRLDALNIRQAGDVEAYGYRTDAVNQQASGEFSKMQGKNALLSGFVGAASSLIGAASPTAGGGSRFLAPKKKSSYLAPDPWRGMRTVG